MSTPRIRFPSVAAVARELIEAKAFYLTPAKDRHPDDPADIDVRLQVQEDGGWDLHFGDSSYDQDHRGYWGASCLSLRTNCRSLAWDLIGEAQDHAACC